MEIERPISAKIGSHSWYRTPISTEILLRIHFMVLIFAVLKPRLSFLTLRDSSGHVSVMRTARRCCGRFGTGFYSVKSINGTWHLCFDLCFVLLSIATESLRKFHATEIQVAGARSCLLSHGDASINNVLYDSETQVATWFDFDLRHDFRCEATSRHADDLRSLLFSAVHLFDVDSIEDWIRSQRMAYPSDEVWAALAKQLSGRWFAFDIFHRSQIARAREKCGLSSTELGQLDCTLTRAILEIA